MNDWADGIGKGIGEATWPKAEVMPARQMTRDEVQAILSRGHRQFDGAWMFRETTDYGHALRAAFMEGAADGSMGFMDAAEAKRAWHYSDARKRLVGQQLGLCATGWRVLCDDPRAAGRPTWLLQAIRRDMAWINSGDIDLLVELGTLRMLIDGRRIG